MKKQFILKSIITLALLGSFLGCETVSEHCQNNPFDASCPKSSSSDGKNRDENGDEIIGIGEELNIGTEAGSYNPLGKYRANLEVTPYENGYQIKIFPDGNGPINTCSNYPDKSGHFVKQDGKPHPIGNPNHPKGLCGPYEKDATWEINSKEVGFDPKKPYIVHFDCFEEFDEIEVKPQ